MTEQEWLACVDPRWMLEHLRKRARSRKLRLFVCACARRAWSRLTTPICREAVEMAERVADKEVKNAERVRLKRTVRDLYRQKATGELSVANCVLYGPRYTHVAAISAAAQAVFTITGVDHPGDNPAAEDAERAAQSELFRDIFGNPFRPVALSRSWKTATVTAVAESIYADRAFDHMPILADALEEAGCTDSNILAHCRGKGPHVRGCWVVDLLLGKE